MPFARGTARGLGALEALRELETPQSVLRVVNVASPVAGAEWTVTVPGGATWTPLSIRASLVTDATVATRLPRLLVDDGSDEYFRVIDTTGASASATFIYTWAPGLGFVQGTAATITIGIPPLALLSGNRIRTLTVSLQAGDQWSQIRLYVLETPTVRPKWRFEEQVAALEGRYPVPASLPEPYGGR